MKSLVFLFLVSLAAPLQALTDEEVDATIQRIEESQKRLLKSLDNFEAAFEKVKERQKRLDQAFEKVYALFEFKYCVGWFKRLTLFGGPEEEAEDFILRCVKQENRAAFFDAVAELDDI